MRRSHPRTRKKRNGFTFVELMVVILIVGLAASAIMLAIPDQGGSVYAEADRFAARTKAIRDNAIIESRPARLDVDGSRYRLSARQGGEWREAGRYDWAPGTRVQMSGGTQGGTRFDSTGMATPLRLVISRGEKRAVIEIGLDGSVHVRR
ncbi:MAG: GspH/FimT family pseudopilin [Allosphingosinicella sp.]